jgi:hypothetical protein
MAECGAGTAGQHRGEFPRLAGESGVADGVDAAVEAVEAAGGQAAFDGTPREAEPVQLGKGDHAVLASRQRRDPLIGRVIVHLPTHKVDNCTITPTPGLFA